MADGEPQPSTSAFVPRGEKRFKYLAQMIGRDTATGIVEDETNGAFPERSIPAKNECSLQSVIDGIKGLNCQFPAVWHGLNRIRHKIEDHTVEGSLIPGDRGQLRGKVRLKDDPFSGEARRD